MEDIKADIEIVRIGVVVDFAHHFTWRFLQGNAILEIAEEQMSRRAFHPASTPVGQLVFGVRVEEAERYYQRRRAVNQAVHHRWNLVIFVDLYVSSNCFSRPTQSFI